MNAPNKTNGNAPNSPTSPIVFPPPHWSVVLAGASEKIDDARTAIAQIAGARLDVELKPGAMTLTFVEVDTSGPAVVSRPAKLSAEAVEYLRASFVTFADKVRGGAIARAERDVLAGTEEARKALGEAPTMGRPVAPADPAYPGLEATPPG